MTEEEKKAIEYLTKDLKKADMLEMTVHTDNESLRVVLNLIQRKDRQIDLMAEELSIFNHLSMCEDCEKICENDYKYTDCDYCIKQYFAEQAKEVEE